MRSMRKVFAAVLGAVLIATLSALANPMPAQAADSGAEAAFVSRINGIRAEHGLGPLAVYGELHSVARDWTDQMVANGGISHNPNLATDVQEDWTKLGENVGVGGDVDSIMQAFKNSPSHYRNLVDPAFNYIGVGVTYDSAGRLYTTHDFMALNEQSAAPTPELQPRTDPSPPSPSAPAVTPPPPPAAPARVKTMLLALRVVDL